MAEDAHTEAAGTQKPESSPKETTPEPKKPGNEKDPKTSAQEIKKNARKGVSTHGLFMIMAGQTLPQALGESITAFNSHPIDISFKRRPPENPSVPAGSSPQTEGSHPQPPQQTDESNSDDSANHPPSSSPGTSPAPVEAARSSSEPVSPDASPAPVENNPIQENAVSVISADKNAKARADQAVSVLGPGAAPNENESWQDYLKRINDLAGSQGKTL